MIAQMAVRLKAKPFGRVAASTPTMGRTAAGIGGNNAARYSARSFPNTPIDRAPNVGGSASHRACVPARVRGISDEGGSSGRVVRLRGTEK